MQWDKLYEQSIRELSIEQVNAAFRRHYSLENFSIIKAGDKAKIEKAKVENL